MYQLIAFDMDGTLLTSKKQLPKAVLKRLGELKMLVNKLYFQQDALCQNCFLMEMICARFAMLFLQVVH